MPMPPEPCDSCGRRIEPRRRWMHCEERVRYCSAACRRRRVSGVDLRLEKAIAELLALRPPSSSICPSEAARRVAGDTAWRDLLEPARRAARRLAHRGAVEITQRGRVVDPADFRGPIRVRRTRR